MKNLFLLDSYAMAFRMFYAYAQNPLKNTKGEDVSMMHGYWGAVLKILKKHKPTHFAIVRDVKHPTFRHELYPEYKANRGPMPEEMAAQLPLLQMSLEESGLPLLSAPGYEADDVMASAAVLAAESGFDRIYIISKDKDMCQIVNRKIHLFKLTKGADGEDFGPEDVLAKYGVYPEQIRDYLALMGDSSDNVPGVPKVGPKTAEQLLTVYGNIDFIYENLSKITKKSLRETLENNREKAFLSRELVTLQTKRAYQGNLDSLEFRGLNVEALNNIFMEHEIFSLSRAVKSMPDKAKFINRSVQKDEEESDELPPEYTLVNTPELFEKFKNETTESKKLSIMLEAEEKEIVGISVAIAPQKSFYFPLNHIDDFGIKAGNLDFEFFKKEFLEILKSEREFIFFNAKSDLHLLAKAFGIDETFVWNLKLIDNLIAAWMLAPGSTGLEFKKLVMEYFSEEIPSIEDIVGRGKSKDKLAHVALEKVFSYSAQKVALNFKLWHKLQSQLQERDFESYFFNQEIPFLKVLFQMEQIGVAINTDALYKLSFELDRRLIKLEREICDIAGVDFNIGSPKQLAEVLFDTLHLPQIKKRSTDVSVLEELTVQTAHPILFLLTEYRELKKMQSTYVNVLPTLVDERTKRIHTSFIQYGTATGRLSSRDPNLQNIPVRSDLGKLIRASFIPGSPENCILAVDYSQIELRMLAHLSGDETLSNSYIQGEDIHARTASAIYQVPLENVDKDMRRNAKVVNFGVLYGMTAFRLSRDLKISMHQAKEFIEGYFNSFSGIKKFIEEQVHFATSNGYVQTLSGRRRYIAGIDSSDRSERQMAERMAVNTPVQGSAADLIKIAMINIQKIINEKNFPLKMMLQVHDELVFECPKNQVEELAQMVKSEMENAIKLNVPLVASVGFGENWLEAH